MVWPRPLVGDAEALGDPDQHVVRHGPPTGHDLRHLELRHANQGSERPAALLAISSAYPYAIIVPRSCGRDRARVLIPAGPERCPNPVRSLATAS